MANDIVIFKNGELELEVNVTPEKETVWLTQQQMAELFDKERSVITKHIGNIFKEKEWIKIAMCKICTLQIPTAQFRFIVSISSFP